MSATTMDAPAGARAGIGVSRNSEEFRTDTHRLAQFARSVDDTNPHHLAGAIALPVFAHVPVMQSMVEVIGKLTSAFVLHGEHDFVFHAPIVPGQRLFTLSTLQGIKATRAGRVLIVRSDTKTHDGRAVCTQYSSCLVTTETAEASSGDQVPARPTVDRKPAETERYALSDDQTRRYADAARDYSPYTIVPEAAARAGFPAPIVHGMCTLAFASRAIVDRHCSGDTRRLKRLGCRFANPLFLKPGQVLTVEHWVGQDGVAGFEATNSEGTAVIRNGYAEIAR